MLIVGFLYAFFSISNIIIAEVNYRHNNTLTIDSQALNSEGCIINQSGVEEFRYGINSFKEKGCGLVTVYNVLNYFDQTKPLQDIIRSFDRHGNNL